MGVFWKQNLLFVLPNSYKKFLHWNAPKVDLLGASHHLVVHKSHVRLRQKLPTRLHTSE